MSTIDPVPVTVTVECDLDQFRGEVVGLDFGTYGRADFLADLARIPNATPGQAKRMAARLRRDLASIPHRKENP